MGSIPKGPHRRDLRYIKFVTGRVNGLPDQEIAASLEFDSPLELFGQLRRDGYPVCPECGESPVKENHCEPPVPKRKARRGTGERVNLPPPSAARELFKRAHDVLGRDIDFLDDRVEYLQDERFVSQDVYEDPRYLPRYEWIKRGEEYVCATRFSEEQWETLCEGLGQEPCSDSVDVSPLLSTVFFRGAPQCPPEPLTRLIAMCVLAGLSVAELLEVLHFDPASANREKIRHRIEGNGGRAGLVKEAQELATWVHGGIVHRGRTTGELSAQEQYYFHHVREQRSKGVPDEEIRRELNERRILDGEPELGKDEVSRLGNLKLGPPAAPNSE